jgi:VWFA-related protein
MKRLSIGFGLGLIVISAAVGIGQQASEPQPSVRDLAAQMGVFTDHVEVTVSNLYVTVTDKKGNPVLGLTPADFVVEEDGKVVEITHFAAYEPELPVQQIAKEVPAETIENESPVVTEPALRSGPRVAILFDNSSLRSNDRSRVIGELRTFSSSVLAKGGKVMVATANQRLELVTGLTGSGEDVARAFDLVLKSRSDGDALWSRKRLLERDIYQSPVIDPRRRIPDYGAVMAKRFESQIEAYRETEMARVRLSFSQLEEMLRMLRGLPGRASVLWVGQDMPLRPGLDLYILLYDKFNFVAPLDEPALWGTERELTREVSVLAGVAQTGPVTVHYLDAADRDRDTGTADLGAAAADSVLMTGTSLSYGPDPVRIRAITEGSQYMATSTGGTALMGTRNVAPYLDQLGDLLVAYYSIGYVRPGAPDGSLHSVQVDVKRKGVTVRAQQKVRNAPRDERLADSALSRLQLDDGVDAVGMELWLGNPQPQQGGRAVIRDLGVRIPADSLLLLPVEGGAVGQLMVAIRILDRKGVPSRPQIDQGPVTIPEGATNVSFTIPLRVPRGTQRIAVAVRDELSGVEASDVIIVDS